MVYNVDGMSEQALENFLDSQKNSFRNAQRSSKELKCTVDTNKLPNADTVKTEIMEEFRSHVSNSLGESHANVDNL